MNDIPLTTGQIAKICNVAPRTVVRWFEKGHFPNSFVIPNSDHRRIPASDFREFLLDSGMPQTFMRALEELCESKRK